MAARYHIVMLRRSAEHRALAGVLSLSGPVALVRRGSELLAQVGSAPVGADTVPWCMLESVSLPQNESAVLLLPARQSVERVLVNRQALPAAAVLLWDGDEVSLPESGFGLHVTRYQVAAVSPATPAQLSQLCAACGLALGETTAASAPPEIYTCVCGVVLHAGPAAPPDCCLPAECPRCTRPVVVARAAGYTTWPEDIEPCA